MENKLYVGNLPWSATNEELHSLFSQAGAVTSAEVMVFRDTGRSRGFAFIVMETAEQANEAAARFNNQDFGGRPLQVNIARPREDRPEGAPRSGGFGGGGDRPRSGGFGGDRPRSGGFGGGGERRGGGGGGFGGGERRGGGGGGFGGGERRSGGGGFGGGGGGGGGRGGYGSR